MSRARELAKLGNQNLLKLDTDNTRVGIASTVPSFTLDVGTGKIRGDGSELIGISAGLGTALTTDQDKPDNLILVYSNPLINKVIDSRSKYKPVYFDKVFNNVDKDYMEEKQNCTGQQCITCRRCYVKSNKSNDNTIIEAVKTNGRPKNLPKITVTRKAL